ncbi:ATP-binding protein [Clostridium tunisiense]|uniref:ATP-binding protein n=1 Tax=Clostridium tunisiense TaxID=219748 RepID=UPI0002E61ADB|nr:sensor histidine kinase [Clostridium tunisiense]
MELLKRIIGAAAIVSIASQINIGIMDTDFRVSAGIIFFAVFLYQYKNFKPVSMGLLSGVTVYILRGAIYFIGTGTLKGVIFSYQLEILFYTFYGVIYALLIRKTGEDNLNKVLLVLIASDIGANLIELGARVIIGTSKFHGRIILTLLLVAVVRSFIVWLALTWIKYYKVLLMKEEHEKRYTRLLWLTAQLKSEMYWMEKNMDNIERVMANSYSLFEEISSEAQGGTLEDKSLAIARDVHEIKKEYQLAIRGIRDLTEDKQVEGGMDFKDIITILHETLKREVSRRNMDVKLSFEPGESFYTSKHYYLMSIFRNLLINSLDAIGDSEKRESLSFQHKGKEQHHIFTISDTGCGIEEKSLSLVFSPGFSTKINYTTGEINRGLGLSVVQHIVEKELKGTITVNSTKGKGATFVIHIPRHSLEVI